VAPWFGGFVHDLTGSYRIAFLIAVGFCAWVGLLLARASAAACGVTSNHVSFGATSSAKRRIDRSASGASMPGNAISSSTRW